MLHDADDEGVAAVAQAVYVDLDGVGQITVEQQRVLAEHGIDLPGLVVRIARLDIGGDQLRQGAEQVVAELVFFADDLHGAAAEHVGRTYYQRQPEIGGHQPRLLHGIGNSVFGCFRCSLSSTRLKRSRSSARSMASGEVPRIGTSASSSARASFNGVWPPNCTITPTSVPLVRSVSMISSTSSAVSGSK